MGFREIPRKVIERFQRGDLVKFWLQRNRSGLLHRGLIHAGMEIIANLLLNGRPVVWRGSRLLQDSPEESQVVLLQLRIHVPASLVWRDRVLLHPFAT